jgi:hypothetical protein
MERRERSDSPRRANQDRYWKTGYQGRGYVQITWKANYEKFGIASTPERALEPETAYLILARGMQQGLFRKGHKLSTYLNDQKKDYVGARNIINGDVKKNGNLIADAARKFEIALLSASESKPEIDKTIEPDKPADPKPEDTVTRVPTDPPTIQVQPRDTSIVTKISAGAAAAAPVVAATGLKIGGVEFKTGGLIAIAAVIIVGMIIAAWLWNAAQNRRHDELKLSMINLADRDKLNVVAGSTTT